jgi:hypothetical protein
VERIPDGNAKYFAKLMYFVVSYVKLSSCILRIKHFETEGTVGNF